MTDQIELMRNLIRGRINEIESYPQNKDRDARTFENWVKEINTAIKILFRVGDHCFAGFPTFSFPPGPCAVRPAASRAGRWRAAANRRDAPDWGVSPVTL